MFLGCCWFLNFILFFSPTMIWRWWVVWWIQHKKIVLPGKFFFSISRKSFPLFFSIRISKKNFFCWSDFRWNWIFFLKIKNIHTFNQWTYFCQSNEIRSTINDELIQMIMMKENFVRRNRKNHGNNFLILVKLSTFSVDFFFFSDYIIFDHHRSHRWKFQTFVTGFVTYKRFWLNEFGKNVVIHKMINNWFFFWERKNRFSTTVNHNIWNDILYICQPIYCLMFDVWTWFEFFVFTFHCFHLSLLSYSIKYKQIYGHWWMIIVLKS